MFYIKSTVYNINKEKKMRMDLLHNLIFYFERCSKLPLAPLVRSLSKFHNRALKGRVFSTSYRPCLLRKGCNCSETLSRVSWDRIEGNNLSHREHGRGNFCTDERNRRQKIGSKGWFLYTNRKKLRVLVLHEPPQDSVTRDSSY